MPSLQQLLHLARIFYPHGPDAVVEKQVCFTHILGRRYFGRNAGQKLRTVGGLLQLRHAVEAVIHRTGVGYHLIGQL